jgi:hypothetical protein
MTGFLCLGDFSKTEVITMRKLAILTSLVLLFTNTASAQDEETRKHLLHELAGPFIIFRANVQEKKTPVLCPFAPGTP